jgi:hypothetical protein
VQSKEEWRHTVREAKAHPGGFNAKEEDCTNYMENWKLLTWIRSARLRLAGHIVCMRDSDPARKSTFDPHMVERMVGRPKRR